MELWGKGLTPLAAFFVFLSLSPSICCLSRALFLDSAASVAAASFAAASFAAASFAALACGEQQQVR